MSNLVISVNSVLVPKVLFEPVRSRLSSKTPYGLFVLVFKELMEFLESQTDVVF